jgi:hypothetical protein
MTINIKVLRVIHKKRLTAAKMCLGCVVGRAGFEPATFRLSVERSSQAELPARFVCVSTV